MHQHNPRALEVRERHHRSVKVWKAERGERGSNGNSLRLGFRTGILCLNPLSEVRDLTGELIQAQQQSTVLLHQLVEAYPNADQD